MARFLAKLRWLRLSFLPSSEPGAQLSGRKKILR